MTQFQISESNFDDVVFSGKNKEYGAFVLRKKYRLYLSVALWSAIFLMISATVGPSVYALLNEKETEAHKLKKITITDLAPPPSIGEEQKVEEINAPPPLKSTIKFTPPVVKPDDQVKDEYIPTVDELKEVDPGIKTEQGSTDGVDYSLIEAEESVVEEKKEEAPSYFVAVEEMPEPIGGIGAIQALIEYPEIAKRAGVEGRVFVLAFVDENGNVTAAKIIKGIGAGCDEAAIEAIKKTKFKPGKQRGTPVKVQVSIPIVFRLQ